MCVETPAPSALEAEEPDSVARRGDGDGETVPVALYVKGAERAAGWLARKRRGGVVWGARAGVGWDGMG
jgi:hypothetical protein